MASSNNTAGLKLSSQDAVKHVINEFGYTSHYSIAKELTSHGLTVQPTQIGYYVKGVHVMSGKVAEHFYDVFGIEITDVFKSKGRPPEW